MQLRNCLAAIFAIILTADVSLGQGTARGWIRIAKDRVGCIRRGTYLILP